MAVPKKKVSRSRRNMRRFSCAYQLKPVTSTLCPVTGKVIRPHSVTLENLETYLANRKSKKDSRKTATV